MSRLKKRPYTLVIDFETANTSPTSACSLGLVVIENAEIIHIERFLIRTPTSVFQFTHIHGLTYKDVENAPTFAEVYHQSLKNWFEKGSLLVAHNVGFDQRVLTATATHYGFTIPKMKTECTVKLSRYKLAIQPANLKNVSQTLGISLNHHEALSDALASAYIYLHVTTGKKPWMKPTGIENHTWARDADLGPKLEDFFQEPLFENSVQKSSVLPLLAAKKPLKTLDLETTLQLNSPKSKEFLTQLLTKRTKK